MEKYDTGIGGGIMDSERKTEATRETNRPTWKQYCQEIGLTENLVNKWLRKWFLEPPVKLPEVSGRTDKELTKIAGVSAETR